MARKLSTRYEDDLRLFPDVWHKVGLLVGAIVVIGFPFYVGDYWQFIGCQTLVAIVGSVALMTLTGYSGQISLGHAAFLAIGAYTMGILTTEFHLPFWLLIPLAGVVSAAVGLIAGVAALRLKGLYLAIVTIGLLYIVRHVLVWYVGSDNEATTIAVYTWFGQSHASAEEFRVAMDYGPLTLWPHQKLYFIFVVIAVAVAWMAKNIHRSNAGRAMMAVRDHDIAASSLGVNPAKAKIMSFGISSFFAGIAGAMFGMLLEDVSVGPFHLDMSVLYIAMIVFGGIGSTFGAVAGAIAVTLVKPFVREFGASIPLISELSTGLQETVLFSILVIAFLLFEPLGLFGIWMRIKRYFLAWPFKY